MYIFCLKVKEFLVCDVSPVVMFLFISHAYLRSRLPSGIFDSLGTTAILRKVIRNSNLVPAREVSANLIANSSD